MTATMHEPSTAEPDRDGIAGRLLVPAFWDAVSIVAMWLAVLFDGIFGGDMIFSNPSSGRPSSRRRYGEPFPVLDADLTPAGPGAALLQLAGVYRAGPGEDGHLMAATPLGGFLDRIAETITQASASAG